MTDVFPTEAEVEAARQVLTRQQAAAGAEREGSLLLRLGISSNYQLTRAEDYTKAILHTAWVRIRWVLWVWGLFCLLVVAASIAGIWNLVT